MRSGQWPRVSATFSLLIGAVVFALMLAVTRSVFGTQFAASSRYLHVIAALLLPALALAADALARRAARTGGRGARAPLDRHPRQHYGRREQRRAGGALPRTAARDHGAARVGRTQVRASGRCTPRHSSRLRSPSAGCWMAFEPGASPSRVASARKNGQPTSSGSHSSRPRVGPRVACRFAGAQRDASAGTRRSSCGAQSTFSPRAADPARAAQVLRFGTSLLSPVTIHTLRAVGGPLTLHISPRSRSAALC